ncbi:hypothetical protein CNQ87_15485 [Lysinibacillus fusiformis]|uniref:hypothetical protein n=1 Tax=Lysinibacillus fusiformis TaxID=28031 RepID=UPI000BBAD60E|nr:hypothetical protein [Lysinibacillus fusiformis]PCD82008.1 hypothetical protein CNQ87_15485 [Lysinibacillus fusiformis]
MEENLRIYVKVSELITFKLMNSKEEKEKIITEMQKEDTLLVTLRMHLYAEKELDTIIQSIFKYPNFQGFKNKLNIVYSLGIMDKPLYDAVLKLNEVRNGFAHKLDYGKDNNIYSKLKTGLSNELLKGHEINVRMIESKLGQIDNERKIRILLTDIWIHLKIFSTSILLKKFDFSNRLMSEIVEEISE